MIRCLAKPSAPTGSASSRRCTTQNHPPTRKTLPHLLSLLLLLPAGTASALTFESQVTLEPSSIAEGTGSRPWTGLPDLIAGTGSASALDAIATSVKPLTATLPATFAESAVISVDGVELELLRHQVTTNTPNVYGASDNLIEIGPITGCMSSDRFGQARGFAKCRFSPAC